MILESTRNERWLSNSYLVGDRPGGHAVVIDTGGPTEPIFDALRAQRLELVAVLCTHHHVDHVLHNDAYAERFGCPICGHGAERERFAALDRELADGEELEVGALRVRALHIPGHTEGQLAFLVNERDVFTGDTLFQGSVGGTRAPGHGTIDQLKSSILDVLLALPPATRVHPGHMHATTVARELDENPFVRLWRGQDTPGDDRCEAFGRAARLLCEARDYDGGTKCWVRYDDGHEDVVPGSRVERSRS